MTIVSDVWYNYLDYNPDNKFRNFIEEGYIIPLAADWEYLRPLKDLKEKMSGKGYYIESPVNAFIRDNLVSTMTSEDFKEINELPQERFNKLLNDTKLRSDEKFLAPGKLELILNTFNKHNLYASILDTPMYIETDSEAIARWKLSQIANSFNLDLDHKVKVTKDFLENISLDIPAALSFDDIKEFKEDKQNVVNPKKELLEKKDISLLRTELKLGIP